LLAEVRPLTRNHPDEEQSISHCIPYPLDGFSHLMNLYRWTSSVDSYSVIFLSKLALHVLSSTEGSSMQSLEATIDWLIKTLPMTMLVRVCFLFLFFRFFGNLLFIIVDHFFGRLLKISLVLV
jgi:hypothetical protein